MYNYIIKNTTPDCYVHYSCQTVHVKKCTFREKIQLLVDFASLALYKTISIHFFTKQYLLSYLHVQLHHWEHLSRLWRTLFMPNPACEEVYISPKIQLLVDFTPLALYKTISIHFLHKLILGKWSSCTITSLRTLLWRTLFMPNRACEAVYISPKIQLLVDITPLALYKTILWLYIKQFLFIFSQRNTC